MARIEMLSTSAIDLLAESTLQVLAKVGIYCQNDDILDALEAWGAQVDRAALTARFPEHKVLDFVDGLRKEAAGARQEPAEGFRAPALSRVSTQVAQFYLDPHTGERRPGNRQDFLSLIQLGDPLGLQAEAASGALDVDPIVAMRDGRSGENPEAQVGHALLLTDVPPLLEPLEAAMLLAEHAHHPGPAFAWNVRQVDYLIEMGEILGLHDWFTWGAICFAHPLRFDKDVADKFVRRARSGFPTGLTGMPVSGVTTPVTPAGFIVVASAEFMATWIAARALNPTVAFEGSIWGATVDFRAGTVSYSSADAMMRAFAAAEFLARWAGQTVTVGGGEYSDACAPGLYAALEKAYKAMSIALFTGHHPPVGDGMLETGKTISPLQLLIDREVTGGVQVLGSDIEVTPETIALDTIFEVGFGLKRSYMGEEHTVRRYRQALWYPPLSRREPWNGPATEEAVLARARRKVDELIASYRKPEVDPGQLARMRAVVERARRELA